MIKAIRGTRDLLPPDTALWNFVEAAVRDVFRAYNFHEIRTPIFEETQLFARSVGEETDIVAKEMYSWYNGPDPQRLLDDLWRNQYWELYRKEFELQHPDVDLVLALLEPEVCNFGYIAREKKKGSPI